MDFGAATVANDVNSFPAVDGDTLLIAASTTGFDKKPQFQPIA
jgi:hypothetical protein